MKLVRSLNTPETGNRPTGRKDRQEKKLISLKIVIFLWKIDSYRFMSCIGHTILKIAFFHHES